MIRTNFPTIGQVDTRPDQARIDRQVDFSVGQFNDVGHECSRVIIAVNGVVGTGICNAQGVSWGQNDGHFILSSRTRVGPFAIGIGYDGIWGSQTTVWNDQNDDFYTRDTRFSRILDAILIQIFPHKISNNGTAIFTGNDDDATQNGFAFVNAIGRQTGNQFISTRGQSARIDLGNGLPIEGKRNFPGDGAGGFQYKGVGIHAESIAEITQVRDGDGGVGARILENHCIHPVGHPQGIALGIDVPESK